MIVCETDSIGQSFRLIGFKPTINKAYRKKLLALGFIPNKTEFTLVRMAPMGDPVEIKLRGFSVSLRKDELDTLIAVMIVKCVENCQTCH